MIDLETEFGPIGSLIREQYGFDFTKAPFPWFGGKRDAAAVTWEALGDCDHYVEPFAGSLATLLLRPHLPNRTYYSETINDADGLLVNAWRSILAHPDETALAASWPVSELDMHARHAALVRWRNDGLVDKLAGSPKWCDPEMAGWWLWGVCCWIGSGWCSGRGAWVTDPESGKLVKQGRAPGRKPGVAKQLPHVSNDGRGVNAPQLREPGVDRKLPHVSDDGRGVNHAALRAEGLGEPEYHAILMPKLLQWLRYLSARLRHVRILCGDWKRAVTTGAAHTLSVRQGGVCGYFLDPPYAGAVRDANLYAVDDHDIAAEVRAWCAENGGNPKNRIVLAGFAGEGHEELEALGWRAVSWFKAGHLKGGMAQQSDEGHQQDRERIWLSPHCLRAEEPKVAQRSLFDMLGGIS